MDLFSKIKSGKIAVILHAKYFHFVNWLFSNLVKHAPTNKLRVAILKISKAEVGKGLQIHKGNEINDFTKLKIGSNVIIGPKNCFFSRGGIEIGDNVLISGHSKFISQSHNTKGKEFECMYKPIKIKEGAWIAIQVVINYGVTVGRNAVIGSGAVVREDAPDKAVVIGNPARVITTRDK
ncbi:MAG: acyltransferase [archaeon]